MIGSLVSFVVIGLLAGWIVGKILKGRGFGLANNLVIGIVGSVVGGVLFWILGFGPPRNIVGSLVTAIVGAFVFLLAASELRKRLGSEPPARR